MIIIEAIFWAAIIILIHVFLFYPLLLWMVSKFYTRPIKKDKNHQQPVSILIAAYNEDQGIEKKLKNLQNQQYPASLVEIIVVSDGSTDKTDEICERFSKTNGNINFFQLADNSGKTVAINKAAELSSNEILLFTDADNVLSEHSLKNIVANFSDQSIGCVGGKLSFYSDEESGTASSGGFYWKYNQFMRSLESKTGSMMGANGALFAVRRTLFEPLKPYLIDDFSTSMKAIFKGYRTIFEEDAIAYTRHTTNIQDENCRRRRIGNRVCTAIKYFWAEINDMDVMNRFKFFSHKLFRYYAMLFMILAFVSNLCLINYSTFYEWIFILQLMFYSLSIMGFYLSKTGISVKIFFIPYYFCTMNYNQFIGAVHSLIGRRHVTWNTENSSR